MPTRSLTLLFAICAALVIGASARSVEISTSPASGLINDGARALDRGDVERGVRLTKEALESHTLSSDVAAVGYNNLCVAYNNLRAYDRALDYCNRAINLNKRNWRFFNNRGTAKFGKGRLDGAIADYMRALKINRRADVLKRNLEMALKRRGETVEDIEAYIQDNL